MSVPPTLLLFIGKKMLSERSSRVATQGGGQISTPYMPLNGAGTPRNFSQFQKSNERINIHTFNEVENLKRVVLEFKIISNNSKFKNYEEQK